MPVVETFIEAYGAHDWDRLSTCFSRRRFKRIGPYVDVISSSEEYLDFLRRVVPTLKDNYRLLAERVVYTDSVAVAELIERLEIDGAMTDIPEVIVFDLDTDGLIEEMHLYLQQPGGEAPVGGRDAMGRAD